MRYKIFLSFLFAAASVSVFAQQPERKPLRIVDSMTQQEKTSRNPILLQSEVDSLIRQFNLSHQQPVQVQEPVKPVSAKPSPELLAGLGVLFLLLVWIVFEQFSHRKKFNKTVEDFNRYLKFRSPLPDPVLKTSPELVVNGKQNFKGGNDMAKEKSTKAKTTVSSLEAKLSELNDEVHKLKKENDGLNRVVKEYNGIQHEYDSLRHGLARAYKVRNYPGYEKSIPETTLLQGVLETENSMANYAYEKFLKPVLSIADSNKNNPAKISEEDRIKVMELLTSLSLFYIEYLYLRVNDLSIGGKMVERIDGVQKGNNFDLSLLKELNLEHGSRALVLRMILEKTQLTNLSYPVFDETNLNIP